MKKSLAFVGASALGLVSATVAASPAMAIGDATEPCTDMSAQVAATGNLTANWYQDCVPQYGLGKAEFTIVADANDASVPFPADFVTLDNVPDAAITTTSTNDIAASDAYLGVPSGQHYYPIQPEQVDTSTPGSQTYLTQVLAPVTSIAAVTEETLPAAVGTECSVATAGYAGAWVATFGSADTTFSQTIDGKPWTYTITANPLPTYFFGSFVEGSLVGPWCLTDGTHTFDSSFSSGGVTGIEQIWGLVFNNVPDLENQELISLGTFARTDVVDPVKPAVLAETGLKVTDAIVPAAIAGGVVLIGGGLLTAAAIRRRRNRA